MGMGFVGLVEGSNGNSRSLRDDKQRDRQRQPQGKGNNNDNGSGHDKSGSGIWGLEVGGVEESEEDAAEGGFAAGWVVPLL
jgi:hypothetical protein